MIFGCLGKINQSGLSIFSSTVCLRSTNQSPTFYKNKRFFYDLKSSIFFWKLSIKRRLLFLIYFTRKKKKTGFLFDEIDIDSYVSHNFLDVKFVQIRKIRLRKGLFREIYSIKLFTFEPTFEYQSFKPTAELHLTSNKFLFSLDNLKLIKNSYNIISKTLLTLYTIPNFVKTSQQSS